jgi:hypothetical protein
MRAGIAGGVVVLGLAGWAIAGAGEGKIASAGVWVHSQVTKMRGLPLGPFVRLPDGRILTVDAPQDVLTSSDEGKTW